MTASPPFSVLVAGDANVDLVLRGDVVPRFGQAEQLLDSGELVLGGSASITACGLARLGVPTALVARVGDDAFGRFTTEALRTAGVDTSTIETDATLPTGISVILSAPGDRAILTVPGTIPTLQPTAVLAALGAARHVHFASYFLQPSLAAGLTGLLTELRARGVTTSLDTNWDPTEHWHGLREVLPHVDFLLPNREELIALGAALGVSPNSTDETVARHLAALGPRIVVKAGSAGGWSVAHGTAVSAAPGLSVDVVDTTGAGDSFNAGYLAALASGITDETERLHWAAAAGSLSTLAAGGTGAQATLPELLDAVSPASRA